MAASPETHAATDPGRSYVESLARGLAVMRAFREQSDRLTLSDVSRITASPRASDST